MVHYITNEPINHLSDDRLRRHGPIYRQIADQIAADILSGRLAPDEQVMSTNQYAAFYRINPATAAKAFQHLVDDGLLYKKRGIGMFVSPDAPERLRARHRQRFYRRGRRPDGRRGPGHRHRARRRRRPTSTGPARHRHPERRGRPS